MEWERTSNGGYALTLAEFTLHIQFWDEPEYPTRISIEHRYEMRILDIRSDELDIKDLQAIALEHADLYLYTLKAEAEYALEKLRSFEGGDEND